MELLIVTGLSGAGKTRVINALEDIGFYCVDNIPPALLGGFVLHIGDDEYDRSMRASIRNMRKSLIRR